MKFNKLKPIFLASTLLASTSVYAQQSFEDHAFKDVDAVQQEIDGFSHAVDDIVDFGNGHHRTQNQTIYQQIKQACRSNKVTILPNSHRYQDDQIDYANKTTKFIETLEECSIEHIAIDIPRNLQSLIDSYIDDEINFAVFQQRLSNASSDDRYVIDAGQYALMIKNAKEYDINIIAFGANKHTSTKSKLIRAVKDLLEEEYASYVDHYFNNETHKIPHHDQEDFYDELSYALEDPDVQDLLEHQNTRAVTQKDVQRIANFILNRTDREKTIVINKRHTSNALSRSFSNKKVSNTIVGTQTHVASKKPRHKMW